jgi:hypothetical protein
MNAAARDERGRPAVVQVRFRRAAAPADGQTASSAAVAAGDDGDEGVAVPAWPDRLLGGHLDELAFDAVRRWPRLAGAALAVGLEAAAAGGLAVVLKAAGGGVGERSWPAAPVLARAVVAPATVDVSWAWSLLRGLGRTPEDHVFALAAAPVPASDEGAARRPGLLRRLGGPPPEPFLTVRAPTLADGPVPRLEELRELDERLADPAVGPPLVIPERLLVALEADERAYRAAVGLAGWQERAWLGLGRIAAGADGGPVAVVERLVAAPETTGRAEYVVLGAHTWVALRRELERAGQEIVLWLHAHSLGALASRPDETPADETPSPRRTPVSGLFLSAQDRAAAQSFRAPWITCAVLDSDAVARHAAEGGVHPGDRLGLWGWRAGRLVPRSAWLA